MIAVTFHWDESSLTIDWPEGRSTRFAAIWLRDQDPQDRDPKTGQRLVDVVDLPERPKIQDVIQREGAFEIHWADQPRLTVLAIDWLRSTLEPVVREIETWTAAEASRLCWSDYASVQRDDHARAAWLAALSRDGIAFLRGVPQVEQEVENAARLLGYITETNYGRIFDVRETASPHNLAYTSVGLGVHTDNPYRDPVPGYQMLHCLIAAAEGGESVFVDGFSVASQLREEDAAALATLAKTPVQFTFRDAETDLTAYRCLVKLDDSGCPVAIHYNNRSISTARVPAGQAEEFYRAYRSFAHRLRSAQFEFRVTLEPGDLVAFDNQRVLHGRTPFKGSRLLQGCYVANDGVASSLAVLKSAQAAGRGVKRVRNLGEVAAPGESVVRDFL